MPRFAFLLAFACSLMLLQRAAAHGDVHEQIAAVSAQLEREPRNAALLLKRGELHRVHQDWGAALADFQRVAALDPDLAAIDFYRGRLLLEAGHPTEARSYLDRFLAREPNSVQALLTRARVHAKLGDRAAAARDYTRAISQAREPEPEFYLERAEALAASGGPGVEDALRGLDEGMKRLGPLITLQLAAIELELARRNFDAALARLEQITTRAVRKETWLARRGEILEQAGRSGEAQKAYESALDAIVSLSAARGGTAAIRDLQQRVRESLVRLTTADSTNKPVARRDE